jgi:hypothetical protein
LAQFGANANCVIFNIHEAYFQGQNLSDELHQNRSNADENIDKLIAQLKNKAPNVRIPS